MHALVKKACIMHITFFFSQEDIQDLQITSLKLQGKKKLEKKIIRLT